jgi:hypothetical protein
VYEFTSLGRVSVLWYICLKNEGVVFEGPGLRLVRAPLPVCERQGIGESSSVEHTRKGKTNMSDR